MGPRDLATVVIKTINDWVEDRATTLAAALACYTVFSIAPLLIIAVAVAGFFFGEDAVRGDIYRELGGLIGSTGAKVIEEMMVSASNRRDGTLATMLSMVVLFFGASGVFSQLQETMNIIWKAKPPKVNGILNWIRVRFLSFAMVVGIGFLLLVSLLITAAISAAGKYLQGKIPGWEGLWQLINLGVSFGVVTILFAVMYKVLPDVCVEWRDVWLGAVVTALLFNVGKLGIGLYLGKTSVASSYGAAGSLAIILIWVYYSAQITFLGAEFAQAHAAYRRSLLERQAMGRQQHPSSERDSRGQSPPSSWLPT
ncbi:MAG TPA: YihY/virulence factor BrkB family protein [Myxococcaceae bacterium]|nr:YihY/virulence factor BrkB family protein [Myxococcaceae bacterium]